MGLFRSQKMRLFELKVPKDNAWEIMNELGKLNSLHLIDLNKDEQVFNRTFANTIRRCDEAERRIKYIVKECENYGVTVQKPKKVEDFLDRLDEVLQARGKAPSTLFEEYEQVLHEKEEFLQQQTKYYKETHDNLNYLQEYKHALGKAREIIANQAGERLNRGSQENEQQLLGTGEVARGGLTYISGAINKSECERLSRLVFRATRGNALTITEPIHQDLLDHTGAKLEKSIYVIIFKDGPTLREKLNKICDSFLGERFDIPANGNLGGAIEEVNAKWNETAQLRDATQREIRNFLLQITHPIDANGSSEIEFMRWFITKEKGLYFHLNYFKLENMIFSGLCWIPVSNEMEVFDIITKLKQNRNIVGPEITQLVDPGIEPPTYFRNDDFTQPFQDIVNTYGFPNYGEVNPAVFTIITFPFLFGVMFGDLAHGLVIFFTASYVCAFKKYLEKDPDSTLSTFIPARYLLLLMGFFAAYNGLIYNEFGAVPIDFFGSCFSNQMSKDGSEVLVKRKDNCVYSFGLDPKWASSVEYIMFTDSFKMKVAVILGVLQMSLGVCMKAVNSIHFSNYLDFFAEFIPQILFLWCLFGYMDVMIIAKWVTHWPDTNLAPSIITLMVNMILKGGDLNGTPLFGNGDGQKLAQNVLAIIAVVCIFWMLLPKPIILIIRNSLNANKRKPMLEGVKEKFDPLAEEEGAKESQGEGNDSSVHSSVRQFDGNRLVAISLDVGSSVPVGGRHSTDSGEIFIHQLIETIEFVLGSISNTASYLRLWALSLAHSELAEVFLDYLFLDFLHGHFGAATFITVWVGYILLSNVTFAVLICMDALEAFLHTLRLHWVEFQNKFYKANGFPFVPFSFEKIIQESEKQSAA